MNTVTHALAPVLLTHFILGKREWIGWRGLIAIGVAGALPDILNPHLSQEARHTSWSHSIFCWALLTVAVLVASVLSRKSFSPKLALLCSFAYFFHQFCDTISGGVAWLYPLRTTIWGEYWVHPLWWIPLDVVLVLTAYFIFRAIPQWKKHRQK